jgi:lipopolysaccharide export LptBFGC system permease protein LptF
LADAPYISPSAHSNQLLGRGWVQFLAILHQCFRLETRLVTALYFQRASILIAVTISIVVGLDVSNNFSNLVNTADSSVSNGVANTLFYATLRAMFVAPSVLLFAGIWGGVWAEYSLAASRERIMLLQCSKSHLLALLPALILGLAVGCLHFAIAGFAKPKAIELEATHFGKYYGLKFDRPAQSGLEWIAGNGFMLKARVLVDEGVQLSDVHVFYFRDDQGLSSIIRAERTRPTDSHNIWAFENGVLSRFPSFNEHVGGEESVVRETRFQHLEFELPISQLWLENFGVIPFLISQPALHAMVNQGQDVPQLYKYQMAAFERYAAILYCVAMTLLSAHLAITRFRSDMMPYHALAVAAVGFVGYFFWSVTSMLGHHAYIPVYWALWSIPVGATVFSFALVGKHVMADRR